MSLMIENSRAGRIIGTKGSTMQSLKMNSGAASLQLDKEPLEVGGQQFRLLTIAGSLASVRRAHYLALDLFYDLSSVVSRVGVQGMGPIRGTTMAELMMMGVVGGMTQGQGQGQGQGLASPFAPPGGAAAGGGGGGGGGGDFASNVIPLPLLNGRTGLHVDVVNQLGEMQAYIGQFGLELQVVDKRARAPAPQSMPPPQFSVQGHAQAGGIGPTGFPHGGSTGAGEGGSSSNTLEFLVPKEQAGAVIGKGGQGLRDIRQETGCKVTLSREEVRGMRVVTVQHENPENMRRAQELVLQRALLSTTGAPEQQGP